MKYRKLVGMITERNITRDEVADYLEVGRSAFYRRLNGEPDFTVTEALKLEKLLGEPVSVIFKEARESGKKTDENDI